MAITLKDAVIITDNNVIEHLKKGNECAFRFIFDKYYDYLCLIADSYLRDNFISETIVGEIIYNLWEIKESVDIKYSLRSYLVRSVKNRCINYLQQEYVQREVSINQYEDKAAIEAKLQALAEVAQKLVQVAQQQADAQQAQSNSKPNDDVVDAEFEEVKDNK